MKTAAAPRTFATIEAVVTSGATEREVLATVRMRLAKLLDNPNLSARDVASNSKRLLEVDRAIRAIDAAPGRAWDALQAVATTDDEPLDGRA